MNKRRIVGVIVLVELIVAIYLGFLIYSKKNKVLGEVSVTPIDKETISYSADDKLEFFYEPNPNRVFTDTSSWLNGEVSYSINADALNERYEYQPDKGSAQYRILTLGDSFTYGEGANTEQNYPEVLEDLFGARCSGQKIEVINLGVGGYDIAYSVQRYKERGQKYTPDLALWLLKDDDFYQVFEYMAPIIQEYNERNQMFSENKLSPQEYNDMIKTINDEYLKLHTQAESIQYGMDAMYSLTDIYNGKLLVFTFPTTNSSIKNIMNNFSKTSEDVYYFEDIRNLYSLTKVHPDGHPTAEGYRMIAEDLFTYLTDSGLVSCN